MQAGQPLDTFYLIASGAVQYSEPEGSQVEKKAEKDNTSPSPNTNNSAGDISPRNDSPSNKNISDYNNPNSPAAQRHSDAEKRKYALSDVDKDTEAMVLSPVSRVSV